MKTKRRLILAIILLPVVATVGIVSYYVIGIGLNVRRLDQHKQALGSAPDLREVAQGCLWLLAHPPPQELQRNPSATDERLPLAIRSKHPNWLDVGPRTVQIEFGGGFVHYGYRFEASEPGAAPGGTLILYGEEPEDEREILRL